MARKRKDVTRSPPLPQGGRANGAGAAALHGGGRAVDPKGGRQVARGERAIESQVTERLHGHRRDGAIAPIGSVSEYAGRRRCCLDRPMARRLNTWDNAARTMQTPVKIIGCLQADNSQSSGASTSTRIAEPGPSGPSSERYRAEGCLAS